MMNHQRYYLLHRLLLFLTSLLCRAQKSVLNWSGINKVHADPFDQLCANEKTRNYSFILSIILSLRFGTRFAWYGLEQTIKTTVFCSSITVELLFQLKNSEQHTKQRRESREHLFLDLNYHCFAQWNCSLFASMFAETLRK